MKWVLPLLCLSGLVTLPVSAQTSLPVEPAQEVHRDENNPEFYLQLIVEMQQKRLFFASLAHLDVFEQRWPKNHRAPLLRADALRHIRDFGQAKRIYQFLVERDSLPGAYHGLGLIAAAEGDLPVAAVHLGHAAKLAPIDARVLNDLGYVQLLLGEDGEARLNLHKAAELAPANRQVGANLALWQLLQGNPERAEQIMEKYGFAETQRAAVREDASRVRQSDVSAGGGVTPGTNGARSKLKW